MTQIRRYLNGSHLLLRSYVIPANLWRNPRVSMKSMISSGSDLKGVKASLCACRNLLCTHFLFLRLIWVTLSIIWNLCFPLPDFRLLLPWRHCLASASFLQILAASQEPTCHYNLCSADQILHISHINHDGCSGSTDSLTCVTQKSRIFLFSGTFWLPLPDVTPISLDGFQPAVTNDGWAGWNLVTAEAHLCVGTIPPLHGLWQVKHPGIGIFLS